MQCAQVGKKGVASLLTPPNAGSAQITHCLLQIPQTRPLRRGRLQNWREDTCSGARIPLFSLSTQTIVALSTNRDRWRRKFTGDCTTIPSVVLASVSHHSFDGGFLKNVDFGVLTHQSERPHIKESYHPIGLCQNRSIDDMHTLCSHRGHVYQKNPNNRLDRPCIPSVAS